MIRATIMVFHGRYALKQFTNDDNATYQLNSQKCFQNF
jgi:hypothetical protein